MRKNRFAQAKKTMVAVLKSVLEEFKFKYSEIFNQELYDFCKQYVPTRKENMNFVVKLFKYLDSRNIDMIDAPYILDREFYETIEEAKEAGEVALTRPEVGGYIIENAVGYQVDSKAKLRG